MKCWARIPLNRPRMHEISRALAHEDAPPASSNSDLLELSSAFEKLRSSDTESCTETKTEGRHGRVPSLQVVPNRTFSVIGAGRTHLYGAPADFVSGMESISFPPQTYKPADIFEPASSAMSTTEHPMVPQTRHRPHTSSDQRRYVDEANLQEPIYFYVSAPGGPKPGIPLRDAITSKFMYLCDRDEQLFQGYGPSISMRLLVRTNFLLFLHICFVTTLISTCPQWKGYQPWSRQIPTRDFRSPPGPITKAKLAKNVAKSVRRFIDVCDTRFCTFWTFTESSICRNTKTARWSLALTCVGPSGLVKLTSTICYSCHWSMSPWALGRRTSSSIAHSTRPDHPRSLHVIDIDVRSLCPLVTLISMPHAHS